MATSYEPPILAEHYMTRFASGSGDTDESPFGSALATPIDDDALKSFDALGEKLMKVSKLSPSELMDTPKSTVLSRNIVKPHSKAVKQLAKFFAPTIKVLASNEVQHHDPQPVTNQAEIHGELEPTIVVDDLVPSPPPSILTDSSSFMSEMSSSTSREQHGNSLYTLPNRGLMDFPPQQTSTMRRSSSTTGLYSDIPGKNHLGDILNFMDPDPAIVQAALEDIDNEFPTLLIPNVKDLPALFLKCVFFLPWCVLVGATILLAPRYLEIVTFSPGYISSPSGIHRFAHWADCALAHVMIFIASFLTLGYWNLPIAISFGSAAFAQFVLTWQDFILDKSVPLGGDDRQSIYLAITASNVFGEMTSVKRTPHGFFLCDLGDKELDDVVLEAEL